MATAAQGQGGQASLSAFLPLVAPLALLAPPLFPLGRARGVRRGRGVTRGKKCKETMSSSLTPRPHTSDCLALAVPTASNYGGRRGWRTTPSFALAFFAVIPGDAGALKLPLQLRYFLRAMDQESFSKSAALLTLVSTRGGSGAAPKATPWALIVTPIGGGKAPRFDLMTERRLRVSSNGRDDPAPRRSGTAGPRRYCLAPCPTSRRRQLLAAPASVSGGSEAPAGSGRVLLRPVPAWRDALGVVLAALDGRRLE